jgi:hypothetical protein
MATQKPSYDASSISPYAYSFMEEGGKPKSLQQRYDDQTVMAHRLNAEAGMDWNSAVSMAKQIQDNQRESNAIKAKEALLQASREAVSLKSQKNDLTKREKFNQFLSDAMDLDPTAIGNFQDRSQDVEKKHMDVLYNEDQQIAKDAQQFLGQKNASYHNFASGALAEAQKYGYGQYPAEAIDPKTHKPDLSKLAEIGVPFYKQKIAQEQTEKAKEFQTKLAQETSLAGARADISANKYAERQAIVTEEQAKRHPERRISEVGQSIRVLDSAISDVLRESGVPKESPEILFQEGKETDENGRPVKDGAYYTWKPSKKGATKITLPKNQVDEARARIKDLNDQRKTIRGSLFSGDVGMMGEGSSSSLQDQSSQATSERPPLSSFQTE